MRLLHTSDWHLGHRLHGAPRDAEHAAFLRWLLERIVDEEVDALIVAGDIFDTANPPAEAQRAYYQFLADCLLRRPELDIVILGGNHDSPARLDAVADVLRPLRIRVLGSLPRDEAGDIDTQEAIVPLHDARGAVAAWLTCVPYLRPTDWPVLPPGADRRDPGSRLLDGLRPLYGELFSAARARRQPGQALLAAAHCLLKGGAVSDDSERRIQLGNSLPLPAELFPPDFAYVALGHLHKAQRVFYAASETSASADRQSEPGHLRYCGSPIPLSFSERTYRHQIVLVELDGERLREVRPIEVPRSREVLSVPETGKPLDEVVALLRELPRKTTGSSPPALLEVRVRLEPGTAQPLLRPIIEEALVGAAARLLRIVCERPTAALEPASAASETPLVDLHPEEVFLRLYQRERAQGDPSALPPAPQLQLFRQLLEEVQASAQGSGAP
jgi:exonuclease SbcD